MPSCAQTFMCLEAEKVYLGNKIMKSASLLGIIGIMRHYVH